MGKFIKILSLFLLISCVVTAMPLYATDVSVTDKNTDVIAAEHGPDPARFRRTVLQYENRIMELENSGGAYENQAGEELIGLGLAYRELGRHEKALVAFNKSLHINRVNRGLDNPEQLPVLDLIIETNTAAGDWEALDANYEYLYWVNRRIHGDDGPGLLNTIDRLVQWHLDAYISAYDPIPFKHVLWVDELFHKAVDIIEKHYGPDDPRLIDALNGVAISNYLITSYISGSKTPEFDEIRSSTLKMDRGENVSEEFIAKGLFLRSSYNTRKRALKRITEIFTANPDLPAEDRAAALVNQGDAYYINGWTGTALENYREAYRILIETGSAKINQLFGKPVRLPSISYPDTDIINQDDGDFVRVTFDVSARGCARRIKVIEESDPDNYMARKYVKKFLRSSLFRPKLENGKPGWARNVELTLSGRVLRDETDRKMFNYDYLDSVSRGICNNMRW